MKGIIRRLIAAVLALVVAAVMMVTISYAWMTISSAPMVGGMNIALGGGTTILIAPNLQKTVDGVTYNYPGVFSEKLNFADYDEYDYLNDLSGLMPVSTADGINWFLPDYYDIFDEEVINGMASVGQIKPISSFFRDTYLEYANIPSADKVRASSGSYIYLDFWVVSPGDEYELRVSKGDNNGGSFMIELMEPTEDGDSYTLVKTEGSIAAAARIGFLVNTYNVSDEALEVYKNSAGAIDSYSSLRGVYQEPDQGYWTSSDTRFTIYEPNGDLHPEGIDGEYYITSPVAWDGGKAYLADIRENLTIQLSSRWNHEVYPSSSVPLSQTFKTAIHNRQNITTAEEAGDYFYNSYLQGNITPYVNKGGFVKNTGKLYSYAEIKGNSIVSSSEMAVLEQAGATDDSLITVLEKNVPQRIRMFVWIEGQDVDCRNQLSTLDFSIGIELAGSNQNVYEKTKQNN